MQNRRFVSFQPFLVPAIALLVIGLGTLALAFFGFKPTVWARWLFFFGWDLLLSSLALPVTWFLNLRFPSDPPAETNVIVRQAIWVGVYGAVLAWLQQERLVTLWTGLGLALGLIAIEYLIRMREKARWQPAPSNDDSAAQDKPTIEK
jgi:hypothetical protein